MTGTNLFMPVMGKEERVLSQASSPGSVYFTTDTRKIYLDIDNEKLPMGGNVGLFYGTMKLTYTPADDQKEFEFKITDIVGNAEDNPLLIPNVNDLILNEDGCFYKVLSVNGEGLDVFLNTEKLTIAGTGGGGGPSSGGDDNDGKSEFKVGMFNIPNKSILQGNPCLVKFAIKATNEVGEYLTNDVGFYQIEINRVLQENITNNILKGVPSGADTIDSLNNINNFNESDINIIDISKYLPVADNVQVTIIIYDNSGVKQTSRNFSVSVSSMTLNWDYNNQTLNEWITTGPDKKESMTLSWSVSGSNIEKVTYITVGDNDRPVEIGRGKDLNYTYQLNFDNFNMEHGVHTIKMWAEAKVGQTVVSTEPIYKNIIVAKDQDPTTIISICLFNKELIQYNTTNIPIYIYSRNNISNNATVGLIENGSLKDTWENVPNLGADINKSVWNYTPIIAGDAIILTVQSGGQEASVTIAVKGLDITIEEKAGYAFKFKASEFSSNNNIENWGKDSEGKYSLTVSDKFDWINGGLKSEDDGQGGKRQFFAIKAGSTATINYPLWKQNAPAYGKHFKFIFKATNCRNYDAQVLACKVDKKIIHVDKTVEYFLLNESEVQLTYAKTAILRNGVIELEDVKEATLNVFDPVSRTEFKDKYVQFEDGIYQCAFIQADPNKPEDIYNTWYKVSVKDSFNGLLLRAQNGEVKTNNESLEVQYCEDSYIELEVEVTKNADNKRYIKFWIDGVPSGYRAYSTSDRFILENEMITIGSNECDVYVYLAKVYEFELSIQEHMDNFYADAPNAEEMVRRYRRNDIMSTRQNAKGEKEIDMFKLAQANPDCLVHHYTVPHMPTTKKDKTYPCSYEQYKGSNLANYRATGAMIKVQGTSSEKYVLAAANLDTDFQYSDNGNVPSGLIDAKTGRVLSDGWKMSDNAIPINYACTKVNVASCEHVNNVINQEWYNRFQPYKSVLRCKNPKARDTMEFTSGILFVTDNSKKVDDSKGISNNVFADVVTDGVKYVDAPYAKMYSIAQMGNSKDNVHVFHDESNPLECCIEVADNQMPQQWMVDDNYNKGDIGEDEKFFEFRYPDGVKNASQEMIDGWNSFVSWMAHSNPQPRYNKFENVTTEKQFKDLSINKKTFTPIEVFVMNNEKTAYLPIDHLDPNISTYYTKTVHTYGYTDLILLDEEGNPVQRTFEPKTFTGFIATNQVDEKGQPWQEKAGYTPMIRGCTIKEYAGTYTHDTYEYRMAKMLQECEDHLIMDSILYHYLFIERHCMIDNVAKNTFWSTEDCQHWNLIKDYDNDTADGNDNQGKFTRSYGMEPTDKLNLNAYVFNAYQSVWFNFIHGLKDACQWMYNQLENAKYTDSNGKQYNVWDPEAYLDACTSLQKIIPERCWIEDYYRKYFRPQEVYDDSMFNSMLEGGQKKFQRKQYETYQNLYISSKYQGISLSEDYLIFRPTGQGLKNIKIPVEVYNDCYIYSVVGGQAATSRVKRNTTAYLSCPVDEIGNATMYVHPGSVYTKFGSLSPEGQLGHFAPDQMSFAGAKKLRELIFATEDSTTQNDGLVDEISFSGNALLEKLYLANLIACDQKLDLSQCPSLLELDTRNSLFGEISVAAGAPITTLHLNTPTALNLSNLSELKDFSISNYSRLNTLNLHSIDTIPNLSKDIMTKALKFADPNIETGYVQYHLTDAKWIINDSQEMNDENIYILDKMLNSKYAQPTMSSDSINRLPYSAAFTGNIQISKNAYDGSNPLLLYNKYVSNDKFANIDLNFEAENAKLYNVIIYDGDGKPFWSRKTVKGTQLNEEFLSAGPSGPFNISAIYKSPTAEFVYSFQEEWIVNDSDSIKNRLPIGLTINSDLHIYPKFEQTSRSYWVTINHKNPITNEITQLLRKEFVYGTKLEEILTATPNRITPYVEDLNNTLSLREGYNFIGYSLVQDSTILISEEKYAVRSEDTLWTVFEFVTDIGTKVHPEYFKVSNLVNGTSADYVEPDPSIANAVGVNLTLAYPIGGKITIPSTFTYEEVEYPVIALSDFIDKGKEITHIFMETNKNNNLYIIRSNCFYKSGVISKLQYFDFESAKLRLISSRAFQQCTNLDVNTFGTQLYEAKARAFLGAFTNNTTTINIPHTLVRIGELAFANLNISTNGQNILNIGDELRPSSLDLTAIDSQSFRQNDEQQYKEVHFYTNRYNNIDQIIQGTTSVGTWFVNNKVVNDEPQVHIIPLDEGAI